MADRILYRIANHLVSVVGDEVVPMLRSMPGFPVFETNEGEPEWTIEFGHKIKKPADWKE